MAGQAVPRRPPELRHQAARALELRRRAEEVEVRTFTPTATGGWDGRAIILASVIPFSIPSKLEIARLTGPLVHAFNPVTLAALGSVSLPFIVNPRGVAVDAAGNFYIASNEGVVVKVAPNGVLVKSLSLGNSVLDVDVSLDGLLLIGTRTAGTWLSDTNLSPAHQIESGRWNSYVTFIPEPGAGVLLGFGLALVGLHQRRNRS